ncbi:STAS domain-containing protein [Variovorax ginsengisoli]|uniref:Anti-anti-sigma factor n=1 Tax=Variovorax ginsengisoli TaxID=363844 RepID=A0ABT9SB15_9BURK|nr:STAS domain-containing protein [Variovorax ginsengisoli]MDP9900946.1 anti-anti-sigma factor [Variovorax ginsengisoli]
MSAHQRIDLEGELTIYGAAPLQARLLAALADAPEGLDIDLAGVTEIDSAGVQLLMATRRAALATGSSVTLCAPSDAVREVFDLFDLASFFALATAASPQGEPA